MLVRPDIDDSLILDCLQREYGLHVSVLTFLPLGADQDTAVFRACGVDRSGYFVKLRKGDFLDASVDVPTFLHMAGAACVVPPLVTLANRLSTRLDPYALILYPYIAGKDAFERPLTDCQWQTFGKALRQLHTTAFPMEITRDIRREEYSPRFRNEVRGFIRIIDLKEFTEPVAAGLVGFLKEHVDETLQLVTLAERLAKQLQTRRREYVLCHGDMHGWNLLIKDDVDFFIVDWDTLVFAPKERDLMFIGCGFFSVVRSSGDEAALFYDGYGQVEIDTAAIAYYRSERIIEDIAVFCSQLLLSNAGGEDRWQSLAFLKSNYQPGGTIETAFRSAAGL